MAFNWIGKSADGKTVTLKQLSENQFNFGAQTNPENVRLGAVVDVESTGLSHKEDQVIEIGIRQFKFNRLTGEVLSLGPSYSAFQDPGVPLSEEITILTGITDEMLKGKSIDWSKVSEILSASQIVIAHNAAFDRPFIDKSAPVSSEKIWACSLKQIDWMKKNFASPKLELLNIYHGFFTDSHRALNDADALLYLLSFKDLNTKAPYLLELLTNAKKPMVHVVASNSPFESKDYLKNRSYRWDGQTKSWSRVMPKEQVESEIEWLKEVVYVGEFRGKTNEIAPQDQFKAVKSV